MPWTYMLLCGDGSTYVGSTRGDLVARIDQHDVGLGAVYTSTRLPIRLIWAQEFGRVDEAWALERRLHGWNRAKRLALAEGRFDDLLGDSVRRRARRD